MIYVLRERPKSGQHPCVAVCALQGADIEELSKEFRRTGGASVVKDLFAFMQSHPYIGSVELGAFAKWLCEKHNFSLPGQEHCMLEA